MKDSKSLTSIFLLFLSFFISSRYIQYLFHDFDLNINSFESIANKCNIKNNSLISYYKKNDRKSIIVIFDGYPDSEIYKNVTGNKSLLHSFLKENSSEYLNTTSIHDHTFVSLANTLGRFHPKSKCRYPFFRGNYVPNMLLSNKWVGSSKALCSELSNYRSKNSFLKYWTRIDNDFSLDGKKFKDLFEKCSMEKSKMIPLIINKIEEYKKINSNIQIIHEMKFHDFIDENIFNEISDKDILTINNYDRNYTYNLSKIIEKIRANNLADELIVMNDHGPRFKFYGSKYSSFKKGGLIDRNNFGTFISRFNFKNDSEILHKLIPLQAERYTYTINNKVIKLKNFKNN